MQFYIRNFIHRPALPSLSVATPLSLRLSLSTSSCPCLCLSTCLSVCLHPVYPLYNNNTIIKGLAETVYSINMIIRISSFNSVESNHPRAQLPQLPATSSRVGFPLSVIVLAKQMIQPDCHSKHISCL